MRIFFLFFGLMWLFPSVALADESKFSKEFYLCLDATNGVNSLNLNCVYEETKKQDDRLNQNYKDLMAVLSEQRRNELREAQRAWIKYRDLYGQYLRNQDGTMLAMLIAADWILECTSSQADFLEGELALMSGRP